MICGDWRTLRFLVILLLALPKGWVLDTNDKILISSLRSTFY